MELITLDYRHLLFSLLFLVNGCNIFQPVSEDVPPFTGTLKAPPVAFEQVIIEIHRKDIVFNYKNDKFENQKAVTGINILSLDETIKEISRKAGNKKALSAVLKIDDEVSYKTVDLILKKLKSNGVRKISVITQ